MIVKRSYILKYKSLNLLSLLKMFVSRTNIIRELRLKDGMVDLVKKIFDFL